MAPTSFSVSAPGTMMLLGEHAVLHEKKSVVLAINKRVKVAFTQRLDRQVVINSSFGRFEKALEDITLEKPLKFVLACVLFFRPRCQKGFELTIESDFSSDLGLGSSAAVTVAVYAALACSLDNKNLKSFDSAFQENILKTARSIVQEVQGVGSGADVAASVYGGVIVYQTKAPFILKRFSNGFPITVLYSGTKTPTVDVIKKVESSRAAHPLIYQKLYEAIDSIVTDAVPCLEEKNWKKLGELLRIQQGLMNALGVGTTALDQLIHCLNENENIYGAKISGSGLGDCVIGIGTTEGSPKTLPVPEAKEIPLSFSAIGVRFE
jgi:mevalonate kinase